MIKLGETYKNKCGNDVRIICVDKRGGLPIVGIVSSNHCDKVMTYTTGGTSWVREGSDYDLIIPEDFSMFEVDEPVMVRDIYGEMWLRRYFAGVKDDKPCTWCNGATSWSVDYSEDMLAWEQCRRPTKEELGEGK